jgi:hypothetical protein
MHRQGRLTPLQTGFLSNEEDSVRYVTTLFQSYRHHTVCFVLILCSRSGVPPLCSFEEVKSRSSTSSVASLHMTYLSVDSIPSRRSSVTTYTSVSSAGIKFDAIPTLTKTPWELERHRKLPAGRRQKQKVFPPHIFKTLPKEVYDCIVKQLGNLHFGENKSCPSCYLKDLYNLALTSRAWDRAATAQLYVTCL